MPVEDMRNRITNSDPLPMLMDAVQRKNLGEEIGIDEITRLRTLISRSPLRACTNTLAIFESLASGYTYGESYSTFHLDDANARED